MGERLIRTTAGSIPRRFNFKEGISILLTLSERLNLLTILPKEGTFLTLKIVRQLREALSPSEEEHKAFGIAAPGQKFIDENGNESIVPNGQLRFKNIEAEVRIGEKANDLIVECLKKLDDSGKLTDNHFSLYEKFVAAQ